MVGVLPGLSTHWRKYRCSGGVTTYRPECCAYPGSVTGRMDAPPGFRSAVSFCRPGIEANRTARRRCASVGARGYAGGATLRRSVPALRTSSRCSPVSAFVFLASCGCSRGRRATAPDLVRIWNVPGVPKVRRVEVGYFPLCQQSSRNIIYSLNPKLEINQNDV